ncbi:MAG: hypothetical protein NTU94_04030, partial [Planctomycetota bacterium]|nr:hypothetical protein [Planctomycetota bacterium]
TENFAQAIMQATAYITPGGSPDPYLCSVGGTVTRRCVTVLAPPRGPARPRKSARHGGQAVAVPPGNLV